MSLFVLDTDTFSFYVAANRAVIGNIAAHSGHDLAVTVTTVEELLSGWLRRVHQARTDPDRERFYTHYAEAVEALAGWRILPMTVAALARHATLMRGRLNVRSPDLRIAAVGLETGATVVTHNFRDYSRVAGLPIVDWTV